MSDFIVACKGIISDSIIDVRGLHSPLPLLRIKKEIAHLNSNQILQANSTDTGCRNDIPGWCSRAGHTYLGEQKQKEYISYFVQKK
ncbi:MAG: sulfurtransferase TusA family protein [Bacteroidetes bacterium]|nr:sulfurtransferase TusA family protein [Bacteroidota bacterium]